MNKYNENIPTGDTNNYVEGLYVKDGRLINGRPNGINGIEKAAALKNMIDRTKKINMIADAIELSQARKNMFEYGLNNFNYIIQKHPDYKKNLGANMVSSFRGRLIFNSISRSLCVFLLNLIKKNLI